jgi:hypothetical protein
MNAKNYTPLLVVAAATFLGCSSLIYHREPRTGLYERRDEYGLGMFADTVERTIQRERSGEKLEISWREYWIDWCQVFHYASYDPHGDSKIQYIIEQRRAAGLPEIPEINNRQFPPEWQSFTNRINFQTDRELQGKPRPDYVKYDASSWLEYWRSIKKQALHNPAISTNGVEYIIARRKQVGLQPLK